MFFIFVSIFSPTMEFNIETDHPLIKNGEHNSLFGFSVAGHQMEFDKNGYLLFHFWTIRLVVGAPFDENSGSIYWCSLYSNKCDRVPFNIHKVAHYSFPDIGNELFGFALSTLPKQQNGLAIASCLMFG